MRIPVFKVLNTELRKEELTHPSALAGAIPWTEVAHGVAKSQTAEHTRFTRIKKAV